MHETNDSFEPAITCVNDIKVEYKGNREKEDVNPKPTHQGDSPREK